MSRNKSSRTVALPDSHWEVLQKEADASNLSLDQALAQAVRYLQMVNSNARDGLQLAFVDKHGNLPEPRFRKHMPLQGPAA